MLLGHVGAPVFRPRDGAVDKLEPPRTVYEHNILERLPGTQSGTQRTSHPELPPPNTNVVQGLDRHTLATIQLLDHSRGKVTKPCITVALAPMGWH